ncbi:MAG: hypothetical protein ACOYJB_08110 [Christensenellaceae bacterium]|jgi:hypothetical protein
MKKVVGIGVTSKGTGYWIHTNEKLGEQQGVGERSASYYLNAESMNEALVQAGLKNAGDLLGRHCGFDARDQFASAIFIMPSK